MALILVRRPHHAGRVDWYVAMDKTPELPFSPRVATREALIALLERMLRLAQQAAVTEVRE